MESIVCVYESCISHARWGSQFGTSARAAQLGPKQQDGQLQPLELHCDQKAKEEESVVDDGGDQYATR
eukprot:366510-Chlamydomonas_euryale.AAC.23